MKAIVVNPDRCNGCHNCQIACKDEHCDQAWLPYAEAQPQIGQFWLKVRQKERGQVPLTKISYVPVMCQHCQDAPCAAAAPEGVFERRDDGLLILKPVKLELEVARRIADACPIGAIYVNEEKSIAQKCTGCAHLLDNGWKEPRCVDVCPTEALRFVDVEDIEKLYGQTEVLDEREGANTLVRYVNLPKRFVGGIVIDGAQDEVVIGADVTLSQEGSVVARMDTDDFGDWLFEQVEPGVYDVAVSAAGYEPRSFTVDITEEDRYAGVCDLS